MRWGLLVVLLGGCAHTIVGVNNAQPSAPASGTFQLNASGAVGAAAIIGIAAMSANDPTAPSSMPSFSIFSDWTSRPAPAMAPEREVAEQDCTKPIDPTGNLRCR